MAKATAVDAMLIRVPASNQMIAIPLAVVIKVALQRGGISSDVEGSLWFILEFSSRINPSSCTDKQI